MLHADACISWLIRNSQNQLLWLQCDTCLNILYKLPVHSLLLFFRIHAGEIMQPCGQIEIQQNYQQMKAEM